MEEGKKKKGLGGLLDKTKGAASSIKGGINKVANKGGEVAEKTKEDIIAALDENGDGKVDLEDIIIKGIRTPGIAINRAEFLKKEFTKHFPEEIINKAIATSPMSAGIPQQAIDDIADSVIQYERNCVSGISAALGMPGGFAMVATIPADIIQYYGYMLRAIQKLLYLYGFPELDTEENGQIFDSETMNILILCFGVMNKVSGANAAIKKISKMLATGVYTQLQKKALTKGVVYPIVKKVSRWFGIKMTKEVFAGFFKKAIPLIGGVIGGTMTYVSFKPCCVRLKDSLKDTILSNPNYNQNMKNSDDIIDAEIDEAANEEIIDAEEVTTEDLKEE